MANPRVIPTSGYCFRFVTRYMSNALQPDGERDGRARRTCENDARAAPTAGLRELRLFVPDVRSEAVRSRIAAQVAQLNPGSEREALLWIEDVSELDADQPRRPGHRRRAPRSRQATTRCHRAVKCDPGEPCLGRYLPN